jgi:putative membrane protein
MIGRGFGYGYRMMGGGLWMGLLWFLLVVGVFMFVMMAVRMARHRHGFGPMYMHGGPVPPARPAGHDEAVAIAKKRLASGEITPEQYGEIMKALGE